MKPMMQYRNVWVCLLLGLVLAGCGRDEPTPTPLPPAVPAMETPAPPEEPTPTAEAVPPVETSPLLTETQAITAATVGTETVFLPLTRNEAGACAHQPDLDLAGYTNVEELMGCPVAVAQFDPVGINEFGAGPEYDRFMLWFSNEQQIYVLLPDQRWVVYPDTWTEGQPTFTCNPLGGEEDSPPLPRRGFGKVWCEVEGLAEIMGPVPREERLCQHTVVQAFERGRLLACYEDATIRYIRLLDDGAWDTILTR
ncbi:MAG: hypothetical protein KJZ93_17010 [Caldilineaceae bacterium]|nr:hypothetical protein [Caldilineaceae bacterium]